MEIYNFTVGLQFPILKYKGQEGPLALYTNKGFEILAIIPDINDKKVNTWSKEPVHYDLFIKDNIPFFSAVFAGSVYLDSQFNIKSLPQEERKRWLENTFQNVSVYLIDSKTFVLKMVRLIGPNIEFSELLKHTIVLQDKNYRTKEDVIHQINIILKGFENKTQMFEKIEMKYKSNMSEN